MMLCRLKRFQPLSCMEAVSTAHYTSWKRCQMLIIYIYMEVVSTADHDRTWKRSRPLTFMGAVSTADYTLKRSRPLSFMEAVSTAKGALER
jgi:hypothetical protein